MKIFGYYPATIIATVQAILAVLVTAHLPFLPLDSTTAAWIITALSAVAVAAEAWTIRPVTVAMLTGAVRTTIVAAVLFGAPINDELSGTIVAAVIMVFGLLTHANGTPALDPKPGFLRSDTVTPLR